MSVDELLAFPQVNATFMPKKLERPLGNRNLPRVVRHYHEIVTKVPQNLRDLRIQVILLVRMDVDALAEEPLENRQPLLKLLPVGLRTVNAGVSQ